MLHYAPNGDIVEYFEFPPTGLKSNESSISDVGRQIERGSYSVSTEPALAPGFYAYNAFDNDPGTFTIFDKPEYDTSTGKYIGDTTYTYFKKFNSKGQSISITLPSKIKIKSFKMTCHAPYYQRVPKSLLLLGSNDGKTWYYVQEWDNIEWSANSTVKEFSVDTEYLFSTYRFVSREHSPGDNNMLHVSDIKIYD